MPTSVKGIKLTMDEDLQKKYELVKEYLEVQADTEVVKILINKFYKDVVEPNLKKREVLV